MEIPEINDELIEELKSTYGSSNSKSKPDPYQQTVARLNTQLDDVIGPALSYWLQNNQSMSSQQRIKFERTVSATFDKVLAYLDPKLTNLVMLKIQRKNHMDKIKNDE